MLSFLCQSLIVLTDFDNLKLTLWYLW